MTSEQEIKLKAQLDELHQWPCPYLFKFIVPNELSKTKEIEDLFDGKAKIKSRLSSKGTYSAYSIVITGTSTEQVLDIYRKAGNIKGLRSL
jgi:putative lipoic acid-binding regulatory protein